LHGQDGAPPAVHGWKASVDSVTIQQVKSRRARAWLSGELPNKTTILSSAHWCASGHNCRGCHSQRSMLSGIGQHGGTWQTEESSGDAGKYCDALCGTSAAKTSVELKGADFRRRSGHRVDASGNKGIITHTKLNQDMDFLPAVIEMTCTTKTLIRARHQNSAVFHPQRQALLPHRYLLVACVSTPSTTAHDAPDPHLHQYRLERLIKNDAPITALCTEAPWTISVPHHRPKACLK